jgi:hypothetical protein
LLPPFVVEAKTAAVRAEFGDRALGVGAHFEPFTALLTGKDLIAARSRLRGCNTIAGLAPGTPLLSKTSSDVIFVRVLNTPPVLVTKGLTKDPASKLWIQA